MRKFLGALLAGAVTMPVAATAQSAGGVPINGADSSNQGAEIVVTAQRRLERAQDVPSSLTVLKAESLTSRGAIALADYAREVPTLNIIGSGGAGTGQPTLRGVSTGADRVGGVGIYLDDVPFTPSSPFVLATAYTFDPDLADIDRLEVLAGPQSTLYGASAMGGLIRYISKAPSLTQAGGSARLFVSGVDGGSVGGGGKVAVTVPLQTDQLGLSASGFWRRDPGFIDNSVRGEKNVNRANVYGGRIALRAKFSENFETTFTGLLQNIDRRGPNAVFINAALRPIAGNTFQSPFELPTKIRYRSAAAQSTLALGFAQVTNILSYSKFAVDNNSDFSIYGQLLGSPSTNVIYNGHPGAEKYTEELRLASKPGRIEWLLGGFITREDGINPLFISGADAAGNLLPPTSLFRNVYTYNTDSSFVEKAIYGDLTFHVTPQLAVGGGVRYSGNRQNLTVATTGLLGVNNIFSRSNDTATTYLGTITYTPTRELTIYAKTGSAYRPGSINPLNAAQQAAGVPSSYGSDYLRNYELGAKGSLLGGRLSFTADIFHMTWTNIQLSQLVNGFSAVVNAAGARINGAEASLTVRPAPGFTITASGDYLDAKYTGSAPSANVLKGNRLPYAPEFSGTVSLDYSRPQDDRVTPVGGVSFSHRGAEFTPLSNNRTFRLPAFDQLDLRAGIEWSRYRIQARVANATNAYGLASAVVSNARGQPISGTLMQPRTYSLSIETRF